MKPLYTRILIVLGIIVVAAAAVWWAREKGGLAFLSPTPTESTAPQASVTPLTIAYDTAPSDWKVYASASAGFKVSYPSDWTFGACAPGCTGWAPPTAAEGQFAMGIIESDGNIDDVLKSVEPYLVGKEEVKAGANTWLKLTLRQPATGDIVTSHFLARGSKLYEFGIATTDSDLLAIYGKMLSSFTFTK